MFRRVIKVYKEDKSTRDKESDAAPSNTAGDTSQSNTPRPVRQRKNKAMPTGESTNKDDESKDKDKSKKKKFKFESHDEQSIIDSVNEFYVWIYSPTTIKQYIMGALLVIGCIGVCLFPLWPAEVRTGVYYLSMVLASLLGVLLSLAVVKYIIFAGIWLLTLGKIKFWLLPNLTEDVGFIESFIPLYKLDIMNGKKTTDDKKESEMKTNDREENNNGDETKPIEAKVILRTESEHDDDDKDKSSSRTSSIDEGDDGNKPQKSSDEDFEVLSKDELDATK
jgi:translocation protein SEC62